MTEYISREEALNFELSVEADPEDIQAITKGMALYAEYIKKVPAANVVERKAETYADRIREMTDEELAEVFSELVDCACCPCNCSDGTCGNCQRQWILWLKQEAK